MMTSNSALQCKQLDGEETEGEMEPKQVSKPESSSSNSQERKSCVKPRKRHNHELLLRQPKRKRNNTSLDILSIDMQGYD